MSVLRAQGVIKRFMLGGQTLEILNGIDLAVETGDSIAILGVSGAGKSTLLDALLRGPDGLKWV